MKTKKVWLIARLSLWSIGHLGNMDFAHFYGMPYLNNVLKVY